MFLLDNLYFEVMLFTATFCWVGFWAAVIVSRKGMKKNAKKLKRMNVIPAGSLVSHGMVTNESKGLGVIRDSEPSENWFRKLL